MAVVTKAKISIKINETVPLVVVFFSALEGLFLSANNISFHLFKSKPYELMSADLLNLNIGICLKGSMCTSC